MTHFIEDDSSGVDFLSMGYLNHDWWRGNIVFWLDSYCIKIWPCIMKRLNFYGGTSCFSLSNGNIGLNTVPTPQTIMVIHQSHLSLHTICTCHGRGVRSFIIFNRPLFCSFITFGGLQIHSSNRDRTYTIFSFHTSWLLHMGSLSGSGSLLDLDSPW